MMLPRCVFIVLLMIPGIALSLDVLHLHSGEAVTGRLESLDAKQVRFQVIVEGPRGRGTSRRTIKRSDIAFIDFAQTDREYELLEKNERDSLRYLYNKKVNLLSVANSNTGEIGLRLIRQTLEQSSAVSANKALEWCEQIMESDWDTDRREEAQRLRLLALVQSGKGEKAAEAAREILDKQTEPAVVVEAHQILGEVTFNQLRELGEAHPRWRDDEEILPQYLALYQSALDHFLYASLFHGSLYEPSARGMWRACEVYQEAGRPDDAVACAQDLIALYPDSSFISKAKPLIESLQE